MSTESETKPVSTSRRGSFAPIDFTEDITKECLKQVEFYFSEFNFPYDKFLRTMAEKNDGWVPISSIATFNRMKKYRPIEKVVEILRTSKILEVSEDGENVKRRVPLVLNKDKEAIFEQNKRTLAIMNIPHENVESLSDLQHSLEEFFNKLGEVNQLRLIRVSGKKFKGTALVEFKTLEICQDVLNTYAGAKDDESKEVLSFEGAKLDVLTKKQYNMQREATRSKNFGGSGQRSRSFTGHRKNMPKLTPPKEAEKDIASAIESETKPEESKD